MRNSLIDRLWRRYQQIGITDAVPPGEERYIRAVNGLVLIVTGLLWLQLPIIITLLPETRYILAAFLLWPLLAQLVPLLNYSGRYTAARLFYSFSTPILIAFIAVQLGPEAENHLFMIAAFLGAFIIFPPREVRWLVLMVLVSAMAMLLLEWHYRTHGGLIDFSPEFIELTRWSSISALFMVVLGITIYHYRVVIGAERELALEHQRSENLLLNILPEAVANRLKRGETPIADRIEDASILFADLVGFTELVDRVPHERVVQILDDLFSEFDRITARYGLEKIKMIGDAYLVAGGLPDETSGHHHAIAACALDMQTFVRNSPVSDLPQVGLRIGIHSGPVVAGVICEAKFAYDIWGDTVNIASRMESHGVENRIQVSAAFYARTCDQFQYESRGPVEIKGKGYMETYFLEGKRETG